LLEFRFAWQFIRLRHVGHHELMREASLRAMERHRHGENGMTVLDRHHAPRRETPAVADTIHLIDDRHFWIAADQEIGVQGMRRPDRHIINRATGGNQSLADDLPAEYPLPARLR